MAMVVRRFIDVGTTFMKNGKKYVVTGTWYEVGGNSFAVEYVRANDDYGYVFPFRFARVVYDQDIEDLKIIKY